MDPILTALEFTRDIAQQKYLHALEDSVTNVEFSAHLAVLKNQSSMLPPMDESCPPAGTAADRGESTTSPLSPAQRRGQRVALARFVEEAKQRAEAVSARAGASPVGYNIGNDTGADISPALERWRVWDDVDGNGTVDHVDSKSSDTLVDLPTWLKRQRRSSEFSGLGYSTTITSFAQSRYWKRWLAQGNGLEPKRMTHSQRRSPRRNWRNFGLHEDDEDLYMGFEAFDTSKTRNSLEKCRSVLNQPAKLEQLRELIPRSRIATKEEYCSIVDSGTNVTIVPCKRQLHSVDPATIIRITGFNSSTSESKGRGTIIGYCRTSDGRQIVPIRVPDVHHLPTAPHGLLSVSAMVKLGYDFHFAANRSYIRTPDGDELDLEQRSGLYWLKWRRAVDPTLTPRMNINRKSTARQGGTDDGKQRVERSDECAQETGPVPSFTLVNGCGDEAMFLDNVDLPSRQPRKLSISSCLHQSCATCGSMRAGTSSVPLMLLHRRLAHWSEDSIEKMVKHRALDMTLSDRARCACDVCRVSKATRRSVPRTRGDLSDHTKPFQRVWTDLKGKLSADFFGNQHLVTFTCEVSRWTCVFFAKTKRDVKKCYQEFLAWVRLQGFKVEQLNSDGGGEYTANENAKVISEFQQISVAHGITQNFTAAYTPEMNGISERLNRTIVEHTRALLVEAGLSKEFWSLAAKHVVYLRNRLWHRGLETSVNVGASPFQIVFGKAPKFSALRVWGCDAWKLDHLHRSSSFGRKAKKMIFVGISPNRKGWVLFDPKTRKTTTTYHCTFDEDMSNRRCALRDFDLRQHKAGAGATADERRLAMLERSLYDDSPSIPYDEPPQNSRPEQQGAEEAHVGPPRPNGHTSGSDDGRPEGASPRPNRRIGGSSGDRSDDGPVIPERRAAIGVPQDLTDEELDFLRTALELNLPMVMQQRNPKRQHSESRARYEKYKSGRTLREVKNLGAKWEDVVWDYSRGYVDFSPTTESNANLAKLMHEWESRGIDSSPAAYVTSEGVVNTSNPFSFLSFEESIQQDYALMAIDHIESLSHRAQRLLQRALGNQTLEQFAHCCASRIMIPDPLSVKEAMASEHAAEWKKAMQEEIDTLTRFSTFKTVARDDALKHGKLVKSKWVFKVKHEPDGSVQRFKARLVAKGFTQIPGTDFYDTYSPVFSYSSLRTLMAMSVDRDFQLDQWDLKSSFVQQKLDVEHMYMEVPEGYDKYLPDGRRAALHCQQSIYGLKQASRLLHERLSKFLLKLGFKQLISDQCVFTKGQGNNQVIVATWVDDIIMASARSNNSARVTFDTMIRTEFEMSPWTNGQADWILNMNVTRDWEKRTLHLSQPKAIEKLAERFGLSDSKRKPYVPMNPLLKLVKPAEDEIIPTSVFDYASAVGGMLYLSLTARPDIAQSVGVLSRFMSCPGQQHVDAAKQVILYLASTKDYGITFTKGQGGSPHRKSDGASMQVYLHSRKSSTATDDVTGDSRIMGTYCDADLAGDEGTRKSTTGYCMLLSGGLICWSSKLQATVALSTAEAETIAATEAVKQVMHLRLFLRELGQEQINPSTVYEDNNAAISLAHGKEQSKRAKHYQLKVHFLNEQFKKGTFAYEKVTTKEQLADAFTKALPRDVFNRYRDWMGVKKLKSTETVGADTDRERTPKEARS